MTNAIGSFLKSVFPSSIDRNGEVFKALLADGEGGGTIEAVFEELEATRSAWQDALDAYSLLEEQNEKLFGLISLLSQTEASSDSVYMARNKMLFAGDRASRAPWGSVHDVRELFKSFFGIEEVWLVNNCASIDESLLVDGDFENEQDAWTLSKAEFTREKSFSGNISVLFERSGTLRQAVSITEAGAYFLNFFLLGEADVRVQNSAGQYWKPIENGTGEWQAEDSYWEFSSDDWDNCQCFFVLEGADTVTIEIMGHTAGTYVDYARLHLKTATSMFTVIAGYGGGTSSSETAAYAPPKTKKLGIIAADEDHIWIQEDDITDANFAYAGIAMAGTQRTWAFGEEYEDANLAFAGTGVAGSDTTWLWPEAYSNSPFAYAGAGIAGTHRAWTEILPINYEVMSYMDNSYIFGASGMTAQEVSTAFLELVKPAGVKGYVEVLSAETETSSTDGGEEAGAGDDEGYNGNSAEAEPDSNTN